MKTMRIKNVSYSKMLVPMLPLGNPQPEAGASKRKVPRQEHGNRHFISAHSPYFLNRILKNVFSALLIPLAVLGITAFHSSAPAAGLLPEGLTIRDDFTPGYGKPVGTVRMVRGEVVIIHKDMPDGYRAAAGLSLYQGDTVVTTVNGRIRFSMIDGSVLTLASSTKLVINRSIFETSKGERASFIKMAFGKARFLVKKLPGFKRSDFEVQTKTAIIGVRGSDFVVKADINGTEASALDKTIIHVTARIAPGATPAVLAEFERIVVKQDGLPSGKTKMTKEEIEFIKNELFIPVGEKTEISEKDIVRIREDRLVQPAFVGVSEGGMSDIGEKTKKAEENRELKETIDDIVEGQNEADIPDTPDIPDDPGDTTGPTGTGGVGGTI